MKGPVRDLHSSLVIARRCSSSLAAVIACHSPLLVVASRSHRLSLLAVIAIDLDCHSHPGPSLANCCSVEAHTSIVRCLALT